MLTYPVGGLGPGSGLEAATKAGMSGKGKEISEI